MDRDRGRAPRLTRRRRALAALAGFATPLVLAVAVPAGATPAPTPAPGGALTVPLPPGTSLAPGAYRVVVSGSGGAVTTMVSVGAPAPAPAPAPADDGTGTDALGVTVLVLLALLLLGGGLLVIRAQRSAAPRPAIAPDGAKPASVDNRPAGAETAEQRRRVQAYRRLVQMIDAGEYHEALPGLTRIEGTLPPGVRPEARFYTAFALYQLGYLDEAEHLLAALHREDEHGRDVAYLLAYLRVQRRDFDGAEPVLRTTLAGRGLKGTEKRLYGIIEYERALAALRDGNVDEAARLFERVQRLGDFRDRVPADLRNRHLLLGARALLDRDVDAARTQFSHLQNAADRLDPERRSDLLASAKLGTALAAWIENAPDSPATIESLLVDAVRLLDPSAPTTARWPLPFAESTLSESLDDLDDGATTDEQRDRRRMMRDIHFLRGMAVLRAWVANPAPEGFATYLNRAIARFACARAIDPTFADCYLVVGLLLFHLGGDRYRQESLSLLREARLRGARDPEVVRILNARDRPASAGTDSILDVFDSYLDDPSVRAAVREDLLRRRARFGRLRDESAPADPPAPTAPTVTELTERASLLAEKVRMLGDAGGAVSAARQAADDLARANETLAAQVRVVESQEAALLALLSNAILDGPGR